MIFKGKRSGRIHNFTMYVNSDLKCIEKFRGGVHWYMMESKGIFSSIRFNLINDHGNLVPFKDQYILFKLSIKEV